jgi:methyltransferase (TIGR00027 family)
MEEGSPSKTAQGAALLRAVHQLADSPKIFDDPLALTIVGEEAAAAIRAGMGTPAMKETEGLRAFIAVRSRFTEDSLSEAVAHGVRQYVLLGAGLDTFAYRNPHSELTVFEVDHPSTQSWKRAQLEKTKIIARGRVSYAPVDFERETLRDGLAHAGFDFSQAAFFAWLGVTPYLSKDAIAQTLSFVASLPKGSAIAFEYVEPVNEQTRQLRSGFNAMAERVAAAGEPFRSYFTPEEMAGLLRQSGFAHIEDFDTTNLNTRYFADRADGLKLRGAAHMVLAAV